MIRGFLGLLDGCVNFANGNPVNLLVWAAGIGFAAHAQHASADTKALYTKALAEAWKESYTGRNEVSRLDEKAFGKYLGNILDADKTPSFANLDQLNERIVAVLRDKNDLPESVETGRFLYLTRSKFEASLQKYPKNYSEIILYSFRELETFVQHNKEAVGELRRQLKAQQGDIDRLRQRNDPDVQRQMINEDVRRVLDERLPDMIAAQALLERTRERESDDTDVTTLRFQVENGNIVYGEGEQAVTFRDFGDLLRRLAAPPLLQLTTSVYHKNLKPSEVLSSAREIVPFYGRDGELDDLYAWCEEERADSIDVRLYTGKGGVGKTRLLRQLCRRMLRDDEGWHAGFLQIDPDEKQDFTALCEPERPTLVVIDDAMLYTNEIAEFINEIDQYINQRSAERTRTAPFRVVLLARTAGDWWETVKRKVERQPVEPTEVAPLLAGSRAETFEQAVAAFADARKHGAAPAYETPSALLDREPFGRILLIHMLALLTVERTADQADTSEMRILDDILELEGRHWKLLYTENDSADRLFSEDHARYIVRHLLCLATLGYRIKNQRHFIQLCNELSELELQKLSKAERKRLADILDGIYRDDNVMLAPLKPDLLGEHLIERTLFDAEEEEITDEGEEIVALAFDSEAADDGSRGKDTKRGLEILIQLAQRRTGEGLKLLEAVLTPRMQALAADPSHIFLLPDDTIALREIILRFTQIAYNEAEKGSSTQAALANNLGIRLDALGYQKEALKKTQEAVNLYRKLARDMPSTFYPNLAGALNNLGVRFEVLEQHENSLDATQKAVALYYELAKTRPDAFNPDLAMALNNLCIRLDAFERHEDALNAAQQAVALYRKLVAQTRSEVFNLDLATALNNLGASLDTLGRPEEALIPTQEAVSIYRQLAQKQSDTFNHRLAGALDTMGCILGNLGESEHAHNVTQEAVKLLYPHFKDFPTAFAPWMKIVINNYLKRCEALNRYPDQALLSPITKIFDDLQQ